MSSETIYKCDKCNKKVEDGQNFVSVRVELKIGFKLKAKGFKDNYFSYKDVCLSCAEKFNLITKIIQEEDVKLIVPVSIQEKLYEVISEIVWEQNQN